MLRTNSGTRHVPVDNRHAGLIGQSVGITFSPAKINTDEASICHTEVVPHAYFGGCRHVPLLRTARVRRLPMVSDGPYGIDVPAHEVTLP